MNLQGGVPALNPILNYAEFRTNPEPYVVRGVVQGPFFEIFDEAFRH